MKYVENVSMCLCAMCVFSLGTYLFMSFVYFLIGLFVYLLFLRLCTLLIFKTSLYMYSLLMVSFSEPKFYILMKSCFFHKKTISSLQVMILVLNLPSHYQTCVHLNFVLKYLLGVLQF